MARLGRKEEYTKWKFMRITACYAALFNGEDESRVSGKVPKMKFPGFRAGGAESGEKGWFPADLIAGLSVALVLIPQALAYAELAGLPAPLGLIAAAFPAILAAPFASSPYLQTGPTALTSLLTFGILSAHFASGSSSYIAAAALLALLVGLIRVSLGLLKLGAIAYFMSRPVLQGFTSAAAVLIIVSQLPTALGLTPPVEGLWSGFFYTLLHPQALNPLAISFTLLTLLLVLGAKRLSPLIPGVLIAVTLATLLSFQLNYPGPVVGAFQAGLPLPSLLLPWAELPQLLLGAAVIAVIGFAEPAAIARTYAQASRKRWNPNRELLSQGVANLTSGLFGGFPVGGSFSRSALNKEAGTNSRWSGLITGLTVLAFLPLAFLLAPLPKAVLAAIVIGAVLGLLAPANLLSLWRYARLEATTAYATFLLTLLLAPRVDYAVVIGIGLAVAVHLYREAELGIRQEQQGDSLTLYLSGVLWFGSAQQLEEHYQQLFPLKGVQHLIIDASALGRVDLSGSLLLNELTEDAQRKGIDLQVVGLKEHMQRVLDRVQRP